MNSAIGDDSLFDNRFFAVQISSTTMKFSKLIVPKECSNKKANCSNSSKFTPIVSILISSNVRIVMSTSKLSFNSKCTTDWIAISSIK